MAMNRITFAKAGLLSQSLILYFTLPS